ncbi:MAG: hypothetical protein V2I33_24640 [Kangiellaceae bacterium]|jgi:hypothetical protein|nr:hypothetical protein [Kangiellaceae bacterium]
MGDDIQLYGTTNTANLLESIGSKDLEQVIRGRAAKFIIDKLNRERTPFCVIHPASRFKSLWNIVLVILLLYTATIMPFRMAFIETDWYTPWFFIELVIDALFVVDIYVN